MTTNVEIVAVATYTLRSDETLEEVQQRYVDVYLHGEGEDGYSNKRDLGAYNFNISDEQSPTTVIVDSGLLLALIATAANNTNLEAVYDDKRETSYNWNELSDHVLSGQNWFKQQLKNYTNTAPITAPVKPAIVECGFAELFQFAENKYGIGWNTANDVFFGSALEYGTINECYRDNSLELNKTEQEVHELSRTGKACYILQDWLETSYPNSAKFFIHCE